MVIVIKIDNTGKYFVLMPQFLDNTTLNNRAIQTKITYLHQKTKHETSFCLFKRQSTQDGFLPFSFLQTRV